MQSLRKISVSVHFLSDHFCRNGWDRIGGYYLLGQYRLSGRSFVFRALDEHSMYISAQDVSVKVSKVSVYLLRNRQQSINESDGLGELGLVGPWVMKMIRRAAGR